MTPEQIAEARRLHVGGDSLRSLAKKFGVAVNTIKNCVVARSAEIKACAQQLVDTQDRLAAMPIAAQIEAIELADELRAISRNLAGSARHGSYTSFRLSSIAAKQVDKIDPENPMESQETLQAISALTKMSNDASALGMQLLNANKASIDKDQGAEPVRVITRRIIDPQSTAALT